MKLSLLNLTVILLFSSVLSAQTSTLEAAENYYKKSVEFESKHIDSSLAYAEKALDLLKKKDTLNALFADILNQHGRVFYYKKDYEKAYNYFSRCSRISLATNNTEAAIKVKVNMAVCQRQLNNTKGALEILYEVVDYYEKNDLQNMNLGKTYVNIADLYLLNKQHEFAANYYTKSESFFKNDTNLFLQLQGNRIANYNAYDTNKSLEIITKINALQKLDSVPTFISAPIYNGMAQTMVKTENYEKGLVYTLKGLTIKKKSGISKGIAIQYNNMGDIYIKTKKYPIAITYLDSALQTAATTRQKFEILKNLQKAHKGTNNLEQSLYYANQYMTLKDSLNEVLTQKEIVELAIKYQTKEQNKFISKLQNLSNLYKILIGIILALGLYFVLKLFRKNKSQKEELDVLQDEFKIYKNKQLEKNELVVNEVIQLKSKAVIKTTDILYIKSDGHYVEYYLDHKTNPEIDRNSLNAVLTLLPETSFFRIHKSYIVNLNRIKIINSTKVMLDNGEWINLSRTYKQKLKEILHKDINF